MPFIQREAHKKKSRSRYLSPESPLNFSDQDNLKTGQRLGSYSCRVCDYILYINGGLPPVATFGYPVLDETI